MHDQLAQHKKEQKEGENFLNNDDIFEKKMLGTEKNKYLRAYGLEKSVSEYFGGRPTKVQFIKLVESNRKESNECVKKDKRKAKLESQEIKKQIENEIVELDKQWEEIFQMMFATQGQQLLHRI